MSLQAEAQALIPALSALPLPLAITDPFGAVVWVNVAFTQWAGGEPGVVVGESIRVDSNACDPSLVPRIQEVLTSGQPLNGTSIWKTRNGEPRTVTYTITPINNAQDRITFLLWSLQVHEGPTHQQSSDSERYAAIISAMSDGVLFHDLDGRIETCNPSAARILGLTAAQLAGRIPVDPIWGPALREDGSPLPPSMLPAMVTVRTGEPVSNAIVGLRRTGGRRHMAFHKLPAVEIERQQGLGRPHHVRRYNRT